jgi:hypothetical protein
VDPDLVRQQVRMLLTESDPTQPLPLRLAFVVGAVHEWDEFQKVALAEFQEAYQAVAAAVAAGESPTAADLLQQGMLVGASIAAGVYQADALEETYKTGPLLPSIAAAVAAGAGARALRRGGDDIEHCVVVITTGGETGVAWHQPPDNTLRHELLGIMGTLSGTLRALGDQFGLTFRTYWQDTNQEDERDDRQG